MLALRSLFSRSGWRLELLFYLSCYLCAETVAWLVTGSYARALANTQSIIAAESRLGLDIELAVQQVSDHLHLLMMFNVVYLAAQFVVLPVALIWLYRRRRQVYLLLRNTIIGSWLVAVPMFGLVPTAPPRLAHIGVQDILVKGGVPVNSGISAILYNPYAAFPSLHVGFAFAVGVAVVFAVSNWPLRIAAIVWGPLVTVTVVATGNHFIFDAVAGVCVTLLGFGLGLVPLGWTSPAPRVPGPRALGQDAGYEVESRLA